MNMLMKSIGFILALAMSVPLATAEESGLPREVRDDYAAYSTERFSVYSTEEAWANQVMTLLERTHDQFYESFTSGGFNPQPIGERLVCLWFSDRDAFDDYAQQADQADMSWSEGYYSAKTNRVALIHQGDSTDMSAAVAAVAAMDESVAQTETLEHRSKTTGARLQSAHRIDIAKTTHEAAHQLAFNSGVQKRGVMYPLWASEGLATNFEADLPGSLGPEADNPVRRRRLVDTWKRDALIPLEELITITGIPSNPTWTPSELYAQSWGFFRFLFQERQEQLADYFEALAQLDRGWRDRRTLIREFNSAFGSVASLEKAWERFLNTLSSGEDTTRISKTD